MFSNVKIGTKVLAGFIFVIIIAVVIGVLGIRGIKTIDDADTMLYEKMTVPIGQVGHIVESFHRIRVNVREILMADNNKEIDRFQERIVKFSAEIKKSMNDYEKTIVTEDGRALFKKTSDDLDAFLAAQNKIILLVKAKKINEAHEYMAGEGFTVAMNAQKHLDEMMETKLKIAKKTADDNTVLANSTTTMVVIILVIGAIAALGLAIFIVRSVSGLINSLLAEAKNLTEAAIAGKLSTRSDASKINFEVRPIVIGVNDCLDAVIGPLNVAAEYVDRISKGDIPQKITDNYNGDFNEIKNNLNQCIDAVNYLVADAAALSKAAVDGKLATRADASKHQGDFRSIVTGVNDCLDAVIGPLNVTAEYVDRISKGDIPPKITDSYNGDFNEIKNNLNMCIETLNGLISEMNNMSHQHDLGDIDIKMDESKFQGSYKEMAAGVNNMVFGHIAVKKKAMACVKEFGVGNFEAPLEKFPGKKVFINDTIEQVRENIKTLITEMNNMSHQHDLGDIDIKMDEIKFQGSYKEMAAGVNNMVFGHIAVKKKAMACVKEFGVGNFEAPLEKFPGKKVFINETIEQVRVNLKALIADANMLSKAAVEGKLATRADATKHQGDFRKIVEGVNNTLDAVIGPLNVSAEYVDRISKGDIPQKITDSYNGDFNEIKNNLNMCIEAINALVKEIVRLTLASKEGLLSERGKADQFQGSYSELISGVNNMLDAILIPIGEGNRILRQIRGGNLREKVEIFCKGDHENMKNAINGVHAWLTELIEYVTKIAQGDLTAQMGKASNDDQIHQWLVMVRDNISDFAVNIQGAAQQVATGSEQMSSATEQISQTATEQSANVEEVTSSMEEMNSSVLQNADNARQTTSIAEKAANDAFEGGKAVNETVKAMKSIAEKIGIIEAIAAQTNMLALNAAIEAARAGEHGKGFAVVASEVRNLAERSKTAAKEISTLSQSSVEVAERAGNLINDMVPQIKKTSDLIQEINASSNEQATGIEQVTKAIEQLDKSIQQNTSATEQMASTSVELSSQAEDMQKIAAFFKVDKTDAKYVKKTTGSSGSSKNTAVKKEAPAINKASIAGTAVRTVPESEKKGVNIDLGSHDDSNFERI